MQGKAEVYGTSPQKRHHGQDLLKPGYGGGRAGRRGRRSRQRRVC